MEHLYEPDFDPGAVIDLAHERFVRSEFAPGCYMPINDEPLEATVIDAHDRFRVKLTGSARLADLMERFGLGQAVTDDSDTL